MFYVVIKNDTGRPVDWYWVEALSYEDATGHANDLTPKGFTATITPY